MFFLFFAKFAEKPLRFDNLNRKVSKLFSQVVFFHSFLLRTEPDMDFLTIHRVPYSGTGPSKTTFALWTNISWRSDASVAERGWKICLAPAPFCSDGLPLTPVEIKDCPPESMILPSCEEANAGELCEGGECGTRTDVNNCYDQ